MPQQNEDDLGGGLSSVLDEPETPRRRRVTNVDLREELAAATAALKDQKWVKALAQKVGRRVDDEEDDGFVERGDEALDAQDWSINHGQSPVQFMRRESGSIPSTPHPMARSLLVPSTPDDLITALDARFFTKGFDAVAYVLESLPTTRDELDDFLQTEISAVDVAKDIVVAKLADDVRANHCAFIQGMKQVQDVDLDLVRAQIHVKNARRLVVSTKNDLIKSSLEIVKTKRNRDRVATIVDLGSRIVHVFDEEERMNEALQKHAFTTAVDICLKLRGELANPELQAVSILKKLIHRVQNFLPELRSQFDKSLRRVAQEFNPLRYKELLQAYITLADHAENLGFEFSATHLSEVLGSIPEIMVRCIDELSRKYLVELFGERASPKKHKTASSAKANSKTNTAAPPTGNAVDNVQRAYERLTELMHTYYLLVQWHRDPFNPSNDDLTYLHRCGIDDDDDDDDEDDDDDADGDENDDANSMVSPSNSAGLRKSFLSPRRRRGSSVSSEPQAPQRSPYSQVLCETGMTLLRYRKIVWETMQQNIINVLEGLDTTYGFKLENIVILSQTTSAFIDVGEEFTGSPSTKLRSILRLKCEQYIASLHDDNLELLRMLIDSENWQRILNATTAVSDAAGMLRLMEKRSGYRFDHAPANSNQAQATMGTRLQIHERTVFPSFQQNGNPFAAQSTRWFSLNMEVEDVGSSSGDSNKEAESPESPELGAMDDEFVLTSSSLSGFVRMSGVYLKMMQHLPHVAWDIFSRLVKLFEFSLYAAFVSFAEPDTIQQLFHAQLPDTATWQTLRTTVARVSSEFNSGEVVLRTVVVPIAGASSSSSTSGDKQIVALRRTTRAPSAMEHASESNCWAFAERTVSTAAVVSQARLLEAIQPLVRAHVAPRYHALVDEVYARCLTSAHELRGFVSHAVAGVALASTSDQQTLSVPALVAQVRWSDVSYVRTDSPSDYVVAIVRRCGEVWGGLQVFSDGAVPVGARDDVWQALVQHVMDGMLTGVASVGRCPPQARALMSVDLVALQNGLDLINHVSVRRGLDHVNRYVKAFYCSTPEELLEWVKACGRVYSKLALASLLRHGAVGSNLAKKELRELVLQVDAVL